MERDRKYWYETYQEQKELSRGQINKLQEQVQELETLLHGSKLMTDEALESIDKLQEENQRYKEALSEIREFLIGPPPDISVEMHEALHHVFLLADNALEGESE